MTLEQLNSLNDDELTMLWYAINKIQPPVIEGVELDVSVFCSVKPHAIINRVLQLEPAIKDEHKPIYESLKSKLLSTPK